MNKSITLPEVNAYGYYEMRLESIGGLGANLAGKCLGELGALYLGLNSASFSSYGSEKRGSPVKAFVRWCKEDQQVRINSPVEHPHLLGLFHLNLAEKLPVMQGVTENCHVVVNSYLSPKETRDRLRMHAGTLTCIDALKIAMDHKTRTNMVMLGALAKASNFIPLDALEQLIEETVGKKYPALLEQNLIGIRQGWQNTVTETFTDDGTYPFVEYEEEKSLWGYDNAPLGGLNPVIGSTARNDLSSSREGYIPLFDPAKCIHCGLCDSTCPDMVFQFFAETVDGKKKMLNKGLDYHYCKGCLRCVDVCPTHALTEGIERDNPNPPHQVRLKDMIAKDFEYTDTGADSYITSEAYLDEQRIHGGQI